MKQELKIYFRLCEHYEAGYRFECIPVDEPDYWQEIDNAVECAIVEVDIPTDERVHKAALAVKDKIQSDIKREHKRHQLTIDELTSKLEEFNQLFK